MESPNQKEIENPTKRQKPISDAHPHHAGAAEALRLKAGQHGKQYDTAEGVGNIVRRRTEVEEQVIAKEQEAELIVDSLPKESSIPKVALFLPEILKDSLFVGHLVTDLDSVAGAIGAGIYHQKCPNCYLLLYQKILSHNHFKSLLQLRFMVGLPRSQAK